MRIRLLLFGALGELAGSELPALELENGARARDALDAMRAAHPELRDRLSAVAIAVNLRFVRPDHVLTDGDEVAVIPPVSGG